MAKLDLFCFIFVFGIIYCVCMIMINKLMTNPLKFQANALTNEEIDDFLQWNQATKDYDVMYQALLSSSRDIMSNWMLDINAQFLSQIGITVDRINSVQVNETSECATNFRRDAGNEIQDVVSQVQNDLEFVQSDYVNLLLDVTDQYVSFNNVWAKTVWNSANMVTSMDLITYQMETYVYQFYKSLFEAQIEEIIIDMQFFDETISETRLTAFVALNSIGDSFESNLLSC